MTDEQFYKIMVAAKSGDAEAMGVILRYYAPYITKCARRTFRDNFGNAYEIIDNELRKRIETKLMIQIVFKFDPTHLPRGEVLEE